MANTEAFVSLIEAPMGGGKTTTSTALMIDKYYSQVYAIESKAGRYLKVKPYKFDFVKLDPDNDIYDKYKDQIIHIPKGYRIHSHAKLICNYHLFGVKYVFAQMRKVLTFVNTPIMKNAMWTVDESYLELESRRGMNPLTIFVTEYAQQMRKLGIELNVLIQHGRFIDWRIRYITKRKILTSYDDKTKMCKLLVQDLKKGTERTIRYWAPTYWPYFDTNELPTMPNALIERARKWA